MNQTIRLVPIAAIAVSITWSATNVGMASAVGSSGPDGSLIAQVSSVSCPAAGNCAAVGFLNAAGITAFVVNQTRGTWGREQPVKGMAALFKGGAYVAEHGQHNFNLTENNGIWGSAKKIRLGARSIIAITSVSCASIGNCSAGGYFTGLGSVEVFVITETNGAWGKSQEVPGSVALNRGGYANLYSVSCGAPGECAAGGVYTPKFGLEEPFLVTQHEGVWGNAREVPGLP